MELKDMCKEVRKALSITQKEFGRIIGCSQTEIGFIEGGFIPPNQDKVKNIVKFYESISQYKKNCEVT